MVDVPNLAIEELKRRVKEKGNKQKPVARDLDISTTYLSDILNGNRHLSENVLAKLGFTEIRVPVRNEEVPQVVRAIENALEVKKGVDRLTKKIFPKIKAAARS